MLSAKVDPWSPRPQTDDMKDWSWSGKNRHICGGAYFTYEGIKAVMQWLDWIRLIPTVRKIVHAKGLIERVIIGASAQHRCQIWLARRLDKDGTQHDKEEEPEWTDKEATRWDTLGYAHWRSTSYRLCQTTHTIWYQFVPSPLRVHPDNGNLPTTLEEPAAISSTQPIVDKLHQKKTWNVIE